MELRRRLQNGPINARILNLCDSRVVVGKGRSSSRKLNGILRSMLGYMVGGRVAVVNIWVDTHHNPADHPSRFRPMPPPGECPSRYACWMPAYRDEEPGKHPGTDPHYCRTSCRASSNPSYVRKIVTEPTVASLSERLSFCPVSEVVKIVPSTAQGPCRGLHLHRVRASGLPVHQRVHVEHYCIFVSKRLAYQYIFGAHVEYYRIFVSERQVHFSGPHVESFNVSVSKRTTY